MVQLLPALSHDVSEQSVLPIPKLRDELHLVRFVEFIRPSTETLKNQAKIRRVSGPLTVVQLLESEGTSGPSIVRMWPW